MTRPLSAEVDRKQPRIRSLLLVDTAEQQQAALRQGANIALLKGFPASSLAAVVKVFFARTTQERESYLNLEAAGPW